MPSGIIRQMVGDSLAHSKTKGKKFSAELGRVLSQENIAKELPKKQNCKK